MKAGSKVGVTFLGSRSVTASRILRHGDFRSLIFEVGGGVDRLRRVLTLLVSRVLGTLSPDGDR